MVLLVMAYSLGIAAWLLANGVHVTVDDGFYYYKIAQHVAGGAGASFDGTSVTTGYHPLWLLFLVPVFWITAQPGTALLIGKLVQALLAALCAGLVFRTARLLVERGPAVLAALVWIMLTYRLALSGMEFSLHALGLVTAAYVYLHCFVPALPERARPYLTLGVVLSLTVLARLDAVMLAAVLGSWLAWRQAAPSGGADAPGCERLVLSAYRTGGLRSGDRLVTRAPGAAPRSLARAVRAGASSLEPLRALRRAQLPRLHARVPQRPELLGVSISSTTRRVPSSMIPAWT